MKRADAIKKRKVESLHLSVGYSCNNSCVFCMEYDKALRCRMVKQFISSGRAYKMMDEHKDVGKIIFTQGEPTLNPELPTFVAYAKKCGYREISIISNGRRYADKDFCLKLIGSGVTEFIVSLHGHTKELHGALTRRKDSFSETARGLKNLSELKKKFPIHIVISHVVNKVNFKFVKHFLRFMDKFAVDEVVFNVVQPLGNNMDVFFSALMPAYSDLAVEIERALEVADNWLVPQLKTQRRRVSIIDLPLCLSEKLRSYMGFGETRILNDKGNTIEMSNVRYKSKGPKCSKCAYADVCEGVYDNYIKHFGWDEFKPIMKNNQ